MIDLLFASGEQVPSAVGLGVLMEKDNTVRQAGGFIVQLMPNAEEEVIEKLEKIWHRSLLLPNFWIRVIHRKCCWKKLLGDMDLRSMRKCRPVSTATVIKNAVGRC